MEEFHKFEKILIDRNHPYDSKSVIIAALAVFYGLSCEDVMNINFNVNHIKNWEYCVQSGFAELRSYCEDVFELEKFVHEYINTHEICQTSHYITGLFAETFSTTHMFTDICQSLLHESVYKTIDSQSEYTISNKFIKGVSVESLAQILLSCPFCKSFNLQSEHLTHRGDLYCPTCVDVDIDVKSSKYLADKHFTEFQKNLSKANRTRYVCYINYRGDFISFILFDCMYSVVVYETSLVNISLLWDLMEKSNMMFSLFLEEGK
jgi:hypothetical protein